jgi:hypothetical protein
MVGGDTGDVIWEENMKMGREKRGSVKEKEEREER